MSGSGRGLLGKAIGSSWFTSSRRFWDRQPDEVRAFLFDTCMLHELTGGLCVAHARQRGPGERVNAEPKNWRIPRKIRSSPRPRQRPRRRRSNPHDRQHLNQVGKGLLRTW